MSNICLLSITASHYRKKIYKLIEDKFGCSFIFGKENSTIKRLDNSIFHTCENIQNKHVGKTKWYYQKGLLRKTERFDVIIDDLGAFCISSWLILFRSKFTSQRVYCWDHGWYGRENFIRKYMKRLYFGLASGTFVYGNYARELMIKNGFNGQKLHVIHNSLDYDSQLGIRNSLKGDDIYFEHFGNHYPVICFIGRLTKVKKLDQLIEAIGRLKKENKLYNVVLIGDGEMQNYLIAKIKELEVTDQVWLYGACYDEKTNAELIFNADLCVAPGNIGLTAMHAMMFGCPCISHDDFPWQMPEFEAIVENKTGSFFKRDDISSLAKAISDWFEENVNRREIVRDNCFNEIDENWNPYKQIELFEKVIDG